MTNRFITKRNCAGSYTVTDTLTDDVCEISQIFLCDGTWWIADAVFNYSDPVKTKREAVQSAKYLLLNAKEQRGI